MKCVFNLLSFPKVIYQKKQSFPKVRSMQERKSSSLTNNAQEY